MLTDISERLASGGRLTDTEAQALLGTTDLLMLGVAATEVRERRHGDRITFVRVAEFPLDGPSPTSAADVPQAAGELRITGVPEDLARATSFVRTLATVAGGRPVSGFSLADLEALAERQGGMAGRRRGSALGDILDQLREAGLELIAEAPLDRLHDAASALERVSQAKMKIGRATIQKAGDRDRLSQLQEVVRLQTQVGGLNAFAPLPRATSPLAPSTGYDDVKQVALARLLVDNIDTIQVDWALYGPKLAQVALTFGADDVDAVSPFDTLELGSRRAPLEEIRRNIRAASLVPVERDGRFQVVTR